MNPAMIALGGAVRGVVARPMLLVAVHHVSNLLSFAPRY
jgi:hypothetical protein